MLLVAIHNQVLSNYTTVVRDTKLQTSFFEVEAFATARACLTGENAPVLIVDLGASATKLYVIDTGVLISSHILTKGGQDITLSISKGLGVTFDHAEHLKRSLGKEPIAEEAKIIELASRHHEYILSEISTMISQFQRKYNKTIQKILFTGGGANFKTFIEAAKHTFSCEVTVASPFSKLETPVFLEETLLASGTAFAPAIGLALRALQD